MRERERGATSVRWGSAFVKSCTWFLEGHGFLSVQRVCDSCGCHPEGKQQKQQQRGRDRTTYCRSLRLRADNKSRRIEWVGCCRDWVVDAVGFVTDQRSLKGFGGEREGESCQWFWSETIRVCRPVMMVSFYYVDRKSKKSTKKQMPISHLQLSELTVVVDLFRLSHRPSTVWFGLLENPKDLSKKERERWKILKKKTTFSYLSLLSSCLQFGKVGVYKSWYLRWSPEAFWGEKVEKKSHVIKSILFQRKKEAKRGLTFLYFSCWNWKKTCVSFESPPSPSPYFSLCHEPLYGFSRSLIPTWLFFFHFIFSSSSLLPIHLGFAAVSNWPSQIRSLRRTSCWCWTDWMRFTDAECRCLSKLVSSLSFFFSARTKIYRRQVDDRMEAPWSPFLIGMDKLLNGPPFLSILFPSIGAFFPSSSFSESNETIHFNDSLSRFGDGK